MESKRYLAMGLLGLLGARVSFAQHEGHHPPPTPTPAPPTSEHRHYKDTAREGSKHNLFQSDMSLMTGMTPRDPMAGMAMPGWHVMDLGIGRLSYNRQGGRSGADAFESSNWNMIHAQRDLGPGGLSLMMMNSLEPATFQKRGSPELFQTGESYRGQRLVDRQHPHDFFMHLSATYRWNLGSDAAAWFQLAPVGEPAIGPTAFMHRASAGENPTAPLGHHWQDSTHISFNVVTVGAGWRWIALESSVFHGAEPDDRRWNIEGGAIDSAAGRAKFFLGQVWSAQVSHAFLKKPEELVPGDTHRTTASIHYGADGSQPFAASLLWGRNDEEHGVSDAFLLEAAWQMTRTDQIYGRAESVEKDFELLAFKGQPHILVVTPRIARIRALTLGYLKDFDFLQGFKSGLGGDVTVYGFPSRLKPVYGDFPVSFHAFLRLRWGKPHRGMV